MSWGCSAAREIKESLLGSLGEFRLKTDQFFTRIQKGHVTFVQCRRGGRFLHGSVISLVCGYFPSFPKWYNVENCSEISCGRCRECRIIVQIKDN